MAKKNALFSAAALIALWLVWVIAYYIVRDGYVLPSFWETFREMGRFFAEASFWRAFGNTVLRTFWAFLVSLALGVGLAVPAHLVGGVRAFFAPVVSLLRTVPTMAIILMLLLCTPRAVVPVVVAALVLFPAAYAAALAALDEVGEEYGELSRAFRISVGRKIVKMYLPLAAPAVLRQAGSIFSLGLKVVISGEVMASTAFSLGNLMQEVRIFESMPRLMALTLIAVITGFALEGLCCLCYRLIVRWRR